MGTRAIYTFEDQDDIYAVYKHWDGYPEGAVGFLEAALAKAWELPRYEADDFAAAFVAANKDGGGNVRLHSGTSIDTFPSDIEYLYEVSGTGGINMFPGDEPPQEDLHVRASRVRCPDWDHPEKREITKLYEGTLKGFRQWVRDQKANGEAGE